MKVRDVAESALGVAVFCAAAVAFFSWRMDVMLIGFAVAVVSFVALWVLRIVGKSTDRSDEP